MKELMKIGAAALIALAAGCASVTYTSPGMLDNVSVKGVEGRKPGQAVLIDTSGFYMFWTIPFVSGDLRWNEQKKSIEGGSSFFKDQVGVNELQSALLKIAESRNCDLVDVYVRDSDSSYAGVSYGGAVGSCFGSSHMSISAVLVPRSPAK
ncbi:MAG: hypothetical protein J6V72_20325 [Kiritimatiellae bacterium]|nr:hypothetical protein [Kiritimatiellia bacterium]